MTLGNGKSINNLTLPTYLTHSVHSCQLKQLPSAFLTLHLHGSKAFCKTNHRLSSIRKNWHTQTRPAEVSSHACSPFSAAKCTFITTRLSCAS